MLINLSNHQYQYWPEIQQEAADREFCSVTDMLFPDMDPQRSPEKIKELAEMYVGKIIKVLDRLNNNNEKYAVHIMGEMTFCFALTCLLLKKDIRCVASTTERITEQKGNRKTSEFRFVRFRDYVML